MRKDHRNHACAENPQELVSNVTHGTRGNVAVQQLSGNGTSRAFPSALPCPSVAESPNVCPRACSESTKEQLPPDLFVIDRPNVTTTANAVSGARLIEDVNESRRSKFSFGKESKLLLLKCVRQHDAHRAEHGQIDKKFRPVYDDFIQNMPPSVWKSMKPPSIKTLPDKLRVMLKARKSHVAASEAASGIVENRSEIDMLLDEILTEKEDFIQERRNEREELNVREEALVVAGQSIQRMALRWERAASVDDEQSDDNNGITGTTPRKRPFEEVSRFKELIQSELGRRGERQESELTVRHTELHFRKEKLRLQQLRWEHERKDRELRW